ncbi:MAG TPA: peptidase T [Anaerolineales bacterium]|nr:peptidase T [Anaerolineales bacterium]
MFPTLLPRFLRYVQVDTQSNADSKTMPSTAKQFDLLRILQAELQEIGLAETQLTENGYVLATLPATVPHKVPVVMLTAHVDTAPAYSGTNVKPLVHANYQGTVIRLPLGEQVLDPAHPNHADLLTAVGKDVITASGDTLLGADNKAGVAILIALAEYLHQHPEIPHGAIRLVFTPDEEIGRGVNGVTNAEIGAQVGYTIDGGPLGELNWETFSGDGAEITIEGVSTHPGDARKYGMVNAVHLVGKLLSMLPREGISPETTDNHEGFIHPYEITGDAAKVQLRFILRDHDNDKLAYQGKILRSICESLQLSYPTARITCNIFEHYRNMGYWLRNDMRPVEKMIEAARRAGVEPFTPPVRGGTDGSRFTQRGLPTPNIFSGGHNYHGPLEWIALQDMEKSVRTLTELVQLWTEERG